MALVPRVKQFHKLQYIYLTHEKHYAKLQLPSVSIWSGRISGKSVSEGILT